jgi:hypothetical protein
LDLIALNLGFALVEADSEPVTARTFRPRQAAWADVRAPLDSDTEPDHSAEALMLHYRGGDENAFRQLYQQYRAPLLRFIHRVVKYWSRGHE